MKTCFGEKARRAGSHRSGREFSRDMRKQKQAANDTNNVQAVRKIKVLRLDAEVVAGKPHGSTPSVACCQYRLRRIHRFAADQHLAARNRMAVLQGQV